MKLANYASEFMNQYDSQSTDKKEKKVKKRKKKDKYNGNEY